jgi:hypothetical protein
MTFPSYHSSSNVLEAFCCWWSRLGFFAEDAFTLAAAGLMTNHPGLHLVHQSRPAVIIAPK